MQEKEYVTEIPLYGYSKEKSKKELAAINNNALRKKLEEDCHQVYAQQFYLSDNPYFDSRK